MGVKGSALYTHAYCEINAGLNCLVNGSAIAALVVPDRTFWAGCCTGRHLCHLVLCWCCHSMLTFKLESVFI